MSAHTVLFAYDGSPAAAQAIRSAGDLLGPSPALVVTVWEEGLAATSMMPSADFGMAPGPLDVETAMEVDEAVESHAHRVADEGAALARTVGFDPVEAVVIADEVNVPETLVHVAEQRGAQPIVIGSRGLTGLKARLLGSTAHAVLRHTHIPVLVIPARRAPEPAPEK